MSVSVCSQAHFWNYMSDLHQMFVCACYLSGGSVTFCRRYDTLCTSGFTNDVIMEHNRPIFIHVDRYRCSKRRHRVVVCRLTLLYCIELAASCPRRWQAPRLDESIVQGVRPLGAKPATHHCLVDAAAVSVTLRCPSVCPVDP